MKVLRAEQVKILDEYTIEHEPISDIDLMERAAGECSKWLKQKFNPSHNCVVFVGPGNNGGDGLVIARHLWAAGYEVQVHLFSAKMSATAQANFERLKNETKADYSFFEQTAFPTVTENTVVIDALFGSGLTRPLEGRAARMVEAVNKLNARVIAIDIPSGLFGEFNTALAPFSTRNGFSNVIKACYTLTLELPFQSFFYADSAPHVGQFQIIPIGLHKQKLKDWDVDLRYINWRCLKDKRQFRSKFQHKGHFGHALLIAGSKGKMGAAVLAAKAALRSGIGLLTVHVPIDGYSIIQTAVPEAMACIDESMTRFCNPNETILYQAIGVGPGIGQKQSTQNALSGMLKSVHKPMVLDADALNILANNPQEINHIPENSILTPHPKEFERLVGHFHSFEEMWQKQKAFAQKHKLIVIVKGAHTAICLPNGKTIYNSTGNPGMATAGSGDVLTGVIMALLAQGYEPQNAAIVGVFAHGLAADMAAAEKGQIGLIASDIVDFLPKAFNEITEKQI